MSDDRYTVAALEKGLRVLSLFSGDHRSLRLTDVTRLSGLPQPTAFRLLKTLQASGYVEQLADSSFRPGPRVLTLGYSALQGLDIAEAAGTPLQRLAATTSETTNLGLLVGGQVLYALRVKNRDLVTANLHVGSLVAANCSSMGKVLLASLDEPERHEVLAELDLASPQGPRAHRTLDALTGDLDAIRARGWGLSDEELAHGLRSAAAPIRNVRGEVVAAINVAVQTPRWPVDRLVSELLPPLLETATEISQRLGSPV